VIEKGWNGKVIHRKTADLLRKNNEGRGGARQEQRLLAQGAGRMQPGILYRQKT
jgi:hypothetical protein